MCRVRLAALPQGQALFRQQQALLQRLDLVCLAATPCRRWAWPRRPAARRGQPGAPRAPQPGAPQRAGRSLGLLARLEGRRRRALAAACSTKPTASSPTSNGLRAERKRVRR
jgi:hypothetical protein